MHIYIGGAHNGKRDFVKATLQNADVQWLEGRLEGPMDTRHPHNSDCQTTVIAGIEKWLANSDLSEGDAIDYVMETVSGDNVIVILTDIGRGIVPMDADQRKLRDVCGRLYQRLIAEADEVTRIWYGLPQTLKKRGEVL
ncbi:bifunctional adenosylcobinamide kinase/adenosylcobinamide-phosphate guanylyltransferase [Sporosarcina limicola]|uniref:Adenosylcobinamide kinase n=1 Tax=Sporosarcina limicola TaxID=34101 RepID=A0A927MKU2_9BACL|nr:bifunctional adenosylcobinamide kinase/adenosylcobinamide-phosphate guanylyltransferase [Sporosarcina limicola]MBE1555741.1 hypothetical protein [Sporosarcina limicola]